MALPPLLNRLIFFLPPPPPPQSLFFFFFPIPFPLPPPTSAQALILLRQRRSNTCPPFPHFSRHCSIHRERPCRPQFFSRRGPCPVPQFYFPFFNSSTERFGAIPPMQSCLYPRVPLCSSRLEFFFSIPSTPLGCLVFLCPLWFLQAPILPSLIVFFWGGDVRFVLGPATLPFYPKNP